MHYLCTLLDEIVTPSTSTGQALNCIPLTMTFILYLLRIIEMNFLLPHQACRLMLPEYKEALLPWNIVPRQHRIRYLCLNPKVWMKFWQNNSIYCLQADTVPRIYISNQTQRSVLFLYRDNRLSVLSVIRFFPFSYSPNSLISAATRKLTTKKVKDAVLSCAVSQTLWHHTIIIALMISIDFLGCTDLTSSSNSNLLIRFEPENSSGFSCRALFWQFRLKRMTDRDFAVIDAPWLWKA